MIKEIKTLSMVEVKEIVETAEDENQEISIFLKKFVKLKQKKARELKKELESLGLMKLKEEYIAKIIDLMPEDASDMNKIFADVSLDENETNKILKTIKKYK